MPLYNKRLTNLHHEWEVLLSLGILQVAAGMAIVMSDREVPVVLFSVGVWLISEGVRDAIEAIWKRKGKPAKKYVTDKILSLVVCLLAAKGLKLLNTALSWFSQRFWLPLDPQLITSLWTASEETGASVTVSDVLQGAFHESVENVVCETVSEKMAMPTAKTLMVDFRKELKEIWKEEEVYAAISFAVANDQLKQMSAAVVDSINKEATCVTVLSVLLKLAQIVADEFQDVTLAKGIEVSVALADVSLLTKKLAAAARQGLLSSVEVTPVRSDSLHEDELKKLVDAGIISLNWHRPPPLTDGKLQETLDVRSSKLKKIASCQREFAMNHESATGLIETAATNHVQKLLSERLKNGVRRHLHT